MKFVESDDYFSKCRFDAVSSVRIVQQNAAIITESIVLEDIEQKKKALLLGEGRMSREIRLTLQTNKYS